MGLLGDKSCPVTFLDLPNDILRQILDYFQFVDEDGETISWKDDHHRQILTKENKARRQTVQQVRLVCRHLCQLASPLLCPVLRVSLDHRSLDAVKQLSRNPFISAGVRGIVVFLDYCPQELAIDLSQYIKHQRDNLGNIERQCYQYAGIRFPRNRDAEAWHEQQVAWPPWFKSYLKSIYRIHSACLGWNTDLSIAENMKHARDDERREDQEIILQGFEDYRQRHEKQASLVTDGCFVNSLASCVIRMPNAAGIAFSHRDNRSSIYDDDLVSFQSKAKLTESLSAPLNWHDIEALEGGAHIIPARILSELPIAVHRSGGRLRSISIECFPTIGGFSFIVPGQLSNAKWIDLRKSFQYLKEFQIGGNGMNVRPLRYDYLTAEEKDPIDNYLDAAFSSICLEDLDISLYALGLNGRRTTSKGFYRLVPISSTVGWQRMRRLKITHVESDQDELVNLCRNLGHSLEELTWCSIKLQNGHWSNVFNVLCERLQGRYSLQKCRAKVRYLSGGEFGVEEEDDDELYSQIEKYICGDGVRENPLVGCKFQ
ncbi:hypothetical protein PISL3812_04884 [Talaromyces islandicus]|uniref:Uncharacterized protein n=1 Tax=Talaromyces islandicus TaxID=28573 RepID=A0A0U1LWT4_TALIS|nr:hypothetical protein PISL3812_04884 [Talaromyces islandicus]